MGVPSDPSNPSELEQEIRKQIEGSLKDTSSISGGQDTNTVESQSLPNNARRGRGQTVDNRIC